MDSGEIRAIVSDMDGVLWRGEEPLPGLDAFFALLRQRGLGWALATNNSSRTRQDYVRKLARMGVREVPAERIVTSAMATAAWLQRHYARGTRVHVFGGEGLRAELREAGFCVGDEDVAVVVAGLKRDMCYEDLHRASSLIRGGARFVGTNPDATFPVANGIAPGAGSLLAALQVAGGAEPFIIGKPHAPMFEAALQLLGCEAEQTLMIGDRLNTDILGGARAGMRTALVLSGISTREELESSPLQPDFVCDSLTALVAALERNRA